MPTMTNLTYPEVFRRVKRVLMEALGVDEEEVQLDATLRGDLGAESIDFLDIAFRLEREFGIKIPRGDMYPEAFADERLFDTENRLTVDGLKFAKQHYPHYAFTEADVGKKSDEILRINVRLIVAYLAKRFNVNPEPLT